MKPEEYQRLKEEYKTHYRKLAELKDKAREVSVKKNIALALEKMNPQGMIDSMEEMLEKLRFTVAQAEARFQVATEEESNSEHNALQNQLRFEEEQRKQHARATLNQLKKEMKVQPESQPIPKPEEIEKSIGSNRPVSTEPISKSTKKTIGRKG